MDGSVSGDKNCFDEPNLIKDGSRDCPNYANAGCYTGYNSHVDPADGLAHEEVYKGCSTFEYGEASCHTMSINGEDGTVYDTNICKDLCKGTNCNEITDTPDHPGGGVPSDKLQCYHCSIIKDHMGNTLGHADESCWSDNPDISHLTSCADGSVCATDMLIDWSMNGQQTVIVNRRCASADFHPLVPACKSENNQVHYAKDCTVACTENGCNNEIDNVIDLHDNKNDIFCYSCSYGYDYTGNLLPNSNSACNLPSVAGRVDTQRCPRYLNAACFTSATWEFDGIKPMEEDHKGKPILSLYFQQLYRLLGVQIGRRRRVLRQGANRQRPSP